MRKLSENEREKLINERRTGATLQRLAEKYGVSVATVHRAVKDVPEDGEVAGTAERTRLETIPAQSDESRGDGDELFAFLESKRDVVCRIIGSGLDMLSDPETLKKANPSQIIRILATLIDKWSAVAGGEELPEEDELSRSLHELAGELSGDE